MEIQGVANHHLLRLVVAGRVITRFLRQVEMATL